MFQFVTTTTKKLVLIAPTVTEMEKWTKWWGEKGPLRDDPRPSFTTDRLPSSPSSSIGQAGGAAAVQHMRTPSNDRRLSTLEKLRGYAGPAQEPFELLPLLLKGELNGASPVCLKHIAKCSEDHLICVLPLLGRHIYAPLLLLQSWSGDCVLESPLVSLTSLASPSALA